MAHKRFEVVLCHQTNMIAFNLTLDEIEGDIRNIIYSIRSQIGQTKERYYSSFFASSS